MYDLNATQHWTDGYHLRGEAEVVTVEIVRTILVVVVALTGCAEPAERHDMLTDPSGVTCEEAAAKIAEACAEEYESWARCVPSMVPGTDCAAVADERAACMEQCYDDNPDNGGVCDEECSSTDWRDCQDAEHSPVCSAAGTALDECVRANAPGPSNDTTQIDDGEASAAAGCISAGAEMRDDCEQILQTCGVS